MGEAVAQSAKLAERSPRSPPCRASGRRPRRIRRRCPGLKDEGAFSEAALAERWPPACRGSDADAERERHEKRGRGEAQPPPQAVFCLAKHMLALDPAQTYNEDDRSGG